jgi:hypothetical protein
MSSNIVKLDSRPFSSRQEIILGTSALRRDCCVWWQESRQEGYREEAKENSTKGEKVSTLWPTRWL